MMSKRYTGTIWQHYNTKPMCHTVLVIVTELLALSLSGCPQPRITTQVLVPARVPDVAKMQRLAVWPFSGRQGDQVTSELEALLVQTQVQGKPYFTVIERAALQRVADE